MSTLGWVLTLLAATLCLLAVVFSLAAVFIPEFRANGSTIAGVILGALSTFASIVIGGIVAERVRKNGSNGEGE